MSQPFLNLHRGINRRRLSRAEVCWLGFAAGNGFMFLVVTLVNLVTR